MLSRQARDRGEPGRGRPVGRGGAVTFLRNLCAFLFVKAMQIGLGVLLPLAIIAAVFGEPL